MASLNRVVSRENQKASPARPVLFVDHATGMGGAERSLLILLESLDRARWEPHLACAGGPLAEQASALDVPVHTVHLPRLRRSPWFARALGAASFRLANLTRRVDAAAVYANTVRAAFYAGLASTLSRRPFLWHMRDFWLSETEPRHSWMDRMGKRTLCGCARKVIVNSRAVAGEMSRCGKMIVVHNGIDLKRFAPRSNDNGWRRLHGIPPDVPLVGMTGRLRPWKGHLRFLQMATAVHARVPEAHFLIVGGTTFGAVDGYAERLWETAQSLEISSRITFTGELKDVRPALAAMDVFVHPGDPEPFGLVNLEAMAMAKPVVAFAHGALPEIVEHEKTGLLVPPGRVTSAADAVAALLGDVERKTAFGNAGRDRVANCFTAARMVTEISNVLEAAAGSHPGSSVTDNPP